VGTGFLKRSCSNKKIERDDDSKKSHPALAADVEKGRGCRSELVAKALGFFSFVSVRLLSFLLSLGFPSFGQSLGLLLTGFKGLLYALLIGVLALANRHVPAMGLVLRAQPERSNSGIVGSNAKILGGAAGKQQ
jgi:hypothetical protein